MKKIMIQFVVIALLVLSTGTALARIKLIDERVKITETDTDKKKILLLADLPEVHGEGNLEFEIRVSKTGPSAIYSVHLDGIERAFGSISRDTTAARVIVPLRYEDVQIQIYLWYASGIGSCEARIIGYLSEEGGTRPSGGKWTEGELPPSGYRPPKVEDDQGPGATLPPQESPGVSSTPKTPEKPVTETTTPPKKEETETTVTPTPKKEEKIPEILPPPKKEEATTDSTPPGEDSEAPGSE